MPILKEIGAKWLVGMAEHLGRNPHIIVNGFVRAGITKALDVSSGELSIRRAAEQFDVPNSTLHDRVSGRVQAGAHSGPPRYLTDKEEELVGFICGCASIGHARSKKEIIAMVQELVKKKGMDGTVTNGWWASFVKRHGDITIRTAEPLAYVRFVRM